MEMVQSQSVTGDAASNVVFGPVIQQLNDVILKEEKLHSLQTELSPMHDLLLYITTKFQILQEADQETFKIWLQLLHNSLAETKSIFHRSEPRQRCLAWLMYCNPGRLSKEIKTWKENRGILQTELKPMENLLLNISAFFRDQQKVGPETLKFRLQQLHKSLTKAKTILLSEPRQRQRCLDCLMSPLPVRLSTEIKEWKVLFHYLFERLQTDFSIVLTAPILKSAALRSLLEEVAEKSIAMQPLSEDEAWVLFRRIAFNNDTVSVSMDIQECAHKIANQCKGLPLAIAVVAAAMTGKTNVVDWENSLDFMKAADSSFPDTPRVDPHLYQALRLSYDALSNSSVKNCFLYCAVYPQHYQLAMDCRGSRGEQTGEPFNGHGH